MDDKMRHIEILQLDIFPILSQHHDENWVYGDLHWKYDTAWYYNTGTYPSKNKATLWNQQNNKWRLIHYNKDTNKELIIQDRFTKRYYKTYFNYSLRVNPNHTFFHIQYPIPFVWIIPGRCKGSIDDYPIFHDVTVIWKESGVERDMTRTEFETLLNNTGYKL